MPDVSGQTDQLFSFLENSGVQLLLITIVALIAFRLVRPLVHRRVVGLIERRAGDGEEGRLTAEESRKARRDGGEPHLQDSASSSSCCSSSS
jgi:hypothetical protein